jgi:hypothetical protein
MNWEIFGYRALMTLIVVEIIVALCLLTIAIVRYDPNICPR